MTTFLPILDRTDGAQNVELCRNCGGDCCRRASGIAIPSDFGATKQFSAVLAKCLASGLWAVDFWEGDPRPGGRMKKVYFVRPARKNALGKLVDPSWGGECVLWSAEEGCALPFSSRPAQCRHLIPGRPGLCLVPQQFNKSELVKAWIPFQRQVKRALRAAGWKGNSQ